MHDFLVMYAAEAS